MLVTRSAIRSRWCAMKTMLVARYTLSPSSVMIWTTETRKAVVTDLLAKLPQGDELRLPLAHCDLFAAAKQAHELDEVDFEAFARLTHCNQARAHSRYVAMVVRA